MDNRMTYPLLDGITRTDEDFSRQADEEHHHTFTGVNVKMVSQFPLDYICTLCV